ncbi:MAG: alpha/beta hydrolase [Christensenellales bacterium]|jgi:acetyl esterase/lipase
MISQRISLIEGRDDVTLTAYVLDDSPEMLRGGARPAVIVCPGGAYIGCSDREGEPVALRFNAMGYHAFVLRYSVYTENKGGDAWSAIGDDPAPKKWLSHPAPMRDIARAMLKIREHAEDWRVDMDRVALCGFSAGAHNCAMYSVYWDKPILTEHFGVDKAQLKPAAAILAYPLIDYLYMKDAVQAMDEKDRALLELCSLAFLGERTPDDDALRAASPCYHVGAHTPPTFIWSTAADALVPIAHSIRMADALARAGVPFEMHIFEEGAHGMGLADQTSAANLSQIDENAAKWAGLAEAWLRKRFALKLPQGGA